MIDQVVSVAKTYLPRLNEKRLREAYLFAKNAHEGQMRKDGSDYIIHPMSAALILTGLKVDEDTLIATILHDVPEDTTATLEEIGEKFGAKVRFLVDGITKLSKVHYRDDMEGRHVESLKKFFIHSAKDPRIILIKLADRLHNMRTIDAVNPEKRMRIARETMEIFVPIANLLGIWELKNQLEDLCFKVLWPNEFKEINDLVQETTYQKMGVLNETIHKTGSLLKKAGINYISIEGREKNLYSIYKKMLRRKKSFSEIYDIIGIRIIVKNVEQCYQTLGILHQNFTPKMGRLKDYIAIPKNNGYKSIHTTVFGLKGVVSEFQIRTEDMHIENEYGIAAHHFYKDDKKVHLKKKLQKKYQWVKSILDLQRDIKDSKKFLARLKLDVFEDRIFVFTPKGDVIDLPKGSTVIDFAYHVHSDLGMIATGAIINGKRCVISTKLESGDTVSVESSEESDGPQISWLSFAKTHLARTHIREFLKEKNRTSVLADATSILDEKIKLLGLGGLASINDLQKLSALKFFNIESWEDVLYKLGDGTIDVADLIHALFTKEDLIGFESAPADIKAYETSMLHKKTDLMNPEKIHKISITIDSRNRIGLLRDLCDELVGLGINIVSVQTLPHVDAQIHRLHFVLEILDITQYENAMYKLRSVNGVLNITRVQNDS